MLAREKWQIKTIAVLERVFEERKRQMEKHGAAMESMPDGTGPDVPWLLPFSGESAKVAQEGFREEYESVSDFGLLTRRHLVVEEVAEAFELDADSPEFVDEIVQVAALLVQWAEYKIGEPGLYRGYKIRIGGPRKKDHKIVEIWDPATDTLIDRTISTTHAERIIDGWQNAK